MKQKQAKGKKGCLIAIIIFAGLSLLSAIFGNHTKNETNDSSTDSNNNITTETTTIAYTVPDETATETTTTESVESSDETTVSDNQQPIILEAGTENEYSEHLTLNAGTEFEENLIVYVLPAGKYNVHNITGNFAQINIYSKDTHITDEGWEEPEEAVFVKLLKEDESTEIEINEEQYIEIHEPAKFELSHIQ